LAALPLVIGVWTAHALVGLSPGASTSLVSRLDDREHVMFRIDPSRLLRQIFVSPADVDLTIDRRQVLRALFEKVAAGTTTGERVEAWVRYLQDRIAHPKYPPMHDAQIMVTDPIWILEQRVGQCGQTNRVLVDGLLAAGIPARIVQLAAHVAAEAFYDGQWHFLDADWLNFGQFVRKDDGSIPSTAEIYRNPELLNSVVADLEFDLYGVPVTLPEYIEPYVAMFRRIDLGGYMTPFYLVKTATPEQERQDFKFGWGFYRVETDPHESADNLPS
jgi:hypothetical protein